MKMARRDMAKLGVHGRIGGVDTLNPVIPSGCSVLNFELRRGDDFARASIILNGRACLKELFELSID